MIETLFRTLAGRNISPEFIIFIVSALPVSELRGAIPLGLLVMKQPVLKTYLIAVLGNTVLVAPLLLLLEPISNKLRKFRLWAKFFDWLFVRTRKRAKLVERFEALRLILFVCVPLPITGAWTGCAAAIIFGIPRKRAIPTILLGIMLAGCIVTLASMGVISFWGIDRAE